MLGIFDIDNNLPSIISNKYENINIGQKLKDNLPEIDKLFVDWIPKYRKDVYARQAEVVLHYVKKGIRTFIFDRYLALEKKEYNWLRKYNVFFFEPVLRGRVGFDYLPQWIEIPEKSYKVFSENRNIDLAYYGRLENRFSSFEKYYAKFSDMYPDLNVVYTDVNIPKAKKKEYESKNLKIQTDVDLSNTKKIILIGSKRDYKNGYIDSIFFDALKFGCLPLLPQEHKYFHLLFEDLIIDNDYTQRFLMGKSIDYVSDVLIDEFYNRIQLYYREFTSSYASDIIVEKLSL